MMGGSLPWRKASSSRVGCGACRAAQRGGRDRQIGETDRPPAGSVLLSVKMSKDLPLGLGETSNEALLLGCCLRSSPKEKAARGLRPWSDEDDGSRVFRSLTLPMTFARRSTGREEGEFGADPALRGYGYSNESLREERRMGRKAPIVSSSVSRNGLSFLSGVLGGECEASSSGQEVALPKCIIVVGCRVRSCGVLCGVRAEELLRRAQSSTKSQLSSGGGG
mmetsp:Transcript_33258/g.77809  ORF Transcript_33258/g.77809 Transcript_33258/m.77809 type:complete len:222 (-) Transcript_33258:70-735(-)